MNRHTVCATGKGTPEQITVLDTLGMEWQVKPGNHRGTASQRAWDRGYQAAARYVEEHGALAVPQGHDAYGLRLDAWWGRQRAARRADRLTDEQITLLDRIGMRWGPLPRPRRAPD